MVGISYLNGIGSHCPLSLRMTPDLGLKLRVAMSRQQYSDFPFCMNVNVNRSL